MLNTYIDLFAVARRMFKKYMKLNLDNLLYFIMADSIIKRNL
ncbi:MAG: hypothetical protein AABY84_13030 [Candidatus Firestonebacteria bacterium]